MISQSIFAAYGLLGKFPRNLKLVDVAQNRHFGGPKTISQKISQKTSQKTSQSIFWTISQAIFRAFPRSFFAPFWPLTLPYLSPFFLACQFPHSSFCVIPSTFSSDKVASGKTVAHPFPAEIYVSERFLTAYKCRFL